MLTLVGFCLSATNSKKHWGGQKVSSVIFYGCESILWCRNSHTGSNSQNNLILLHMDIKNEILVSNYSERKKKSSNKENPKTTIKKYFYSFR